MTASALAPVAFHPRQPSLPRLTLAAALLAQACLGAAARADDAPVPQLSPVRITGTADSLSDPGQTEGSQSYTANTVTVGKGATNAVSYTHLTLPTKA